MKRKLLFLLAILAVVLIAAPASAIVVSLPPGSVESGGAPVSGSASFTFGAGTLTIGIWNTTPNPDSVAQNISDLFFTITGATSGSVTSSSGLLRDVASDGTFTNGGQFNTGWALTNSGGVFHLNGLAGALYTPAETIIGLPNGSIYSNANNSITGNGPHNPFLFGTAAVPVVFNLSIPGVTASTTVSDVIFSFGTTAGNNVPVPIPPAALLMGSGLLGLGLIGWRRRKN